MEEYSLRFAQSLFEATRPVSAAIAGLLSFAAVELRNGQSRTALLAGAAMCLVTMFGFVLNDILDYKKDVVAGVVRPIAAGKLSMRAAWGFALCLFILACMMAEMVRTGLDVILLTLLALIFYTPVARSFPIVKGLYVAGLCLAPLLYGSLIGHAKIAIAAYAIDAFFVFGREIFMDADEIVGDKLAGLQTIPAVVGSSRGRWLGIVMMTTALISLTFVAHGEIGRFAAVTAATTLVIILVWPYTSESTRVAFTRIPMLAAALALASS